MAPHCEGDCKRPANNRLVSEQIFLFSEFTYLLTLVGEKIKAILVLLSDSKYRVVFSFAWLSFKYFVRFRGIAAVVDATVFANIGRLYKETH